MYQFKLNLTGNQVENVTRHYYDKHCIRCIAKCGQLKRIVVMITKFIGRISIEIDTLLPIQSL